MTMLELADKVAGRGTKMEFEEYDGKMEPLQESQSQAEKMLVAEGYRYKETVKNPETGRAEVIYWTKEPQFDGVDLYRTDCLMWALHGEVGFRKSHYVEQKYQEGNVTYMSKWAETANMTEAEVLALAELIREDKGK